MFKTQEVSDDAMRSNPAVFFLVPDSFKSQEMYIKAVEVDPWQLDDAPDHLETQEMCDEAVKDYPFSLQLVPDWFLTRQQIDIWYDGDYIYNDNEMIKWYDGYKKRKTQKTSIKEELLPIAWHPSRWWDWCVIEDEKRDTEKLWK